MIMPGMKAQRGNLKAVGLVRDENGKPKFDDITNIHPAIWELLTNEEKREIQYELHTRERN